jgi:cysteine synthase
VNDVELSLIPAEARPYQGTTAGIATRLVANSVDALVVGLALAGTYAGVIAFLFVVSPRDLPAP